jgi:membrane-associated phospholipid phosphatase
MRHAEACRISRTSPSPRKKIFDCGTPNQSGHRYRARDRPQHGSGPGVRGPRPDWGRRKVLLVLAAAGWIVSRGRSEPLRCAGNYALLITAATSLLPHVMMSLFDQTRPDRRTVVGHIHGVAFSGKRDHAFPSGHAMHMGALASAAGTLPAGPRRAIRAIAVGLSPTRVVVLAHWASDVVLGFALGAALERLLRLWTAYPIATATSKENDHADT